MNPIEQLKLDYDNVSDYLQETKQFSYLNTFNNNFRKVLLLSAGSYFEHQITEVLTEYVTRQSNGDQKLVNFMQKQAITGKYHQLFEWGSQDELEKSKGNANRFWAFFGNDFKIQVTSDLKNKEDISNSIKAFIEIGHLRNILVHSNFAAYNYDQKSTQEIFDLFKSACPFVDYVREKLFT